jgi:adenine deaminase
MSQRATLNQEQIRRRINAAQGRIDSDLVIRDVQYLDVFSCEWRHGDISIVDGTIVGVEPGLPAPRVIDGKNKWLVPGFIDAHVHVESSLMVPENFQRAVLEKGTTSAICDPHEIANVQGLSGIQQFLAAADGLKMDLFVMLSSCVPATDFETNGAGHITAEQLLSLASHPKALGLAEMMNFPGVLHGDPEVVAKLAAFSQGPMDGHCPLVKGRDLSAYAAAGISSCHESSQLEEAREKLSKGLSIWIREGSVAKDLTELLPLLNMATSTSIGFCTDDRNPLDILKEGHIDHLVRTALRSGVPAEVVYRSASWSVARHYGLTRRGAVAPGYIADLILMDDFEQCSLNTVFKSGVPANELDLLSFRTGSSPVSTVKAAVPEARDLEGPSGRVHVITVEEGKILTGREVAGSDAPGVAKLSVLERYGHGSKPSNGYVRGFGTTLRGAIASSVGHDSHNLIVVGDRADDMRAALAELICCGGGFTVVQNGVALATLPLPVGGLMSLGEPGQIEAALKKLHAASRSIGCELNEPFLQLAFLSLPVIPSLKLTDKGLVDVDAFKVIDVRA